MRAVVGGAQPLVAADRALLTVTPRDVLLSALKPAEQGDGIIVRLLNPTDRAVPAAVTLGFPATSVRAVRLDETPCDATVTLDAGTIRLELPPHALRSVLVTSVDKLRVRPSTSSG